MSEAEWIRIGCVGVDSGKVLVIDPSYVGYGDATEQQTVPGKPWVQQGDGVMVRTYAGDGGYTVFALVDDDGNIERIMIDFTVDENAAFPEMEWVRGHVTAPAAETV